MNYVTNLKKVDTDIVTIYDNNTLIKKYEIDYSKNNDCYIHLFTLDYPISDDTDLILFLREDQLSTGCFNTVDDYQFNDYYYTGSDLIDLCHKYDL